MKQVKQGKKGKKSFLKSKKSLVAAALAALIALAGVTYAWFTWSVGVTGGTLKADYVQIDAEFGVYINLHKLFKNYARFGDPNTNPDPIVASAFDDYATKVGSNYFTVPNGAEIFVPFRYFQDPALYADIATYLNGETYTKSILEVNSTVDYADDDLDGLSYYQILAGFGMNSGTSVNPVWHEANFMIGVTVDASGNDIYEYKEVSAAFGDPTGEYPAKFFNRYVTHELPSNELVVGYAIKNLGAACYVNIPSIQDGMYIREATVGSVLYDTAFRYDGSFVNPQWGVAQYGNYVYGTDGTDDLGGWSSGVKSGTRANGKFEGVNGSYKAVYDYSGTGVPDQSPLSLTPDNDGWYPLADVLNVYANEATWLYDSGSSFNVYPLNIDAGNKWYFDTTPTSDWEIQIKATDMAKIVNNYIDAAIAVQSGTKIVIEPDTVLYAETGAYDLMADAAFDVAFAKFGYGLNLSASIDNVYDAVAYFVLSGFDWTNDLANSFVSLTVPEYDIELLYDLNGFTVLHVQGQPFTYQTLETAPTIHIKSTVVYGKYLDNRFVGSELKFDDLGVVAVQNTPAAAFDVFSVLDVATNDKLPTVDFYEGTQGVKSISLSDVSNLSTAYKTAIGY